MNSEKKLDRRIQRTRRALREALIALILEKGYESVTIQEITDRADLNRGTLYLHYRDKHDLLLSSSDDVYNDLLAQFVPLDPNHRELNIPERHMVIILQHVAANADFYRVMLGEHGVASFITRLRQIANQVSLQRLIALRQAAPPNPVPSELVASYAGGAIIGAIAWWLENNLPIPPETLAKYTLQLTVSGVYQTIGLDNALLP
jgi:AcrR family transcriptional regulator